MYRWGAVAVAGNFSDEPADVPVQDLAEIVLATAAETTLEGSRLRLPALAGAVLR